MRGVTVELDNSLETAHKPTSTEGEITGYTWQTSPSGKPIKEAPVKVDDHGMDAMRYGVMYADIGPSEWDLL
jgi:phage terminase large subunit